MNTNCSKTRQLQPVKVDIKHFLLETSPNLLLDSDVSRWNYFPRLWYWLGLLESWWLLKMSVCSEPLSEPLWFSCGVERRGGGGLWMVNGGEVGLMQMSSRFKWGCFFIHEGLIESRCGRDEWNMHGAAVLYQPVGPVINFSSVLCGLIVELQRRATHDRLKWIWRLSTPVKQIHAFWQTQSFQKQLEAELHLLPWNPNVCCVLSTRLRPRNGSSRTNVKHQNSEWMKVLHLMDQFKLL